jgi:hypothetical protein
VNLSVTPTEDSLSLFINENANGLIHGCTIDGIRSAVERFIYVADEFAVTVGLSVCQIDRLEPKNFPTGSDYAV